MSEDVEAMARLVEGTTPQRVVVVRPVQDLASAARHLASAGLRK